MLPERSGDTMSEAIALSSPSGRMSQRARAAATRRLAVALFGPDGLAAPRVAQPDEVTALRRRAAELRGLAERGMKPRAYLRAAIALGARATALEAE